MKRTLHLLLLLVFSAGAVNASTISGMVLDSRGNPILGFRLALVQMETGQRSIVSTDASGRFSLEIGAGEYGVFTADPDAKAPLIRLTLPEGQASSLVFHVGEDGISTEPAQPAAPARRSDGNRAVRTLESIRDYRILQSSPGVGQARETQAMVALINPFPQRRRGRVHGSVYEFHRNDNLDARNFFDPVGEPLPEYKRHQFGISVGAALGEKLNLQGTYDGIRITQGSTLLSHVPTAAMKSGDFSASGTQVLDPFTGEPLPGNRIPESRIHPTSKGLLTLYPDPNRDDPDRNYVNNQPVVRNRNTFSVRGDFQPKAGSSFAWRYDFTDGRNAYVNPLPSFGSLNAERDQSISVSLSDKIGDQLLVSGRFGFVRSSDDLNSVNAEESGLLESVGIPGLSPPDSGSEGYPDFWLSGYASFGDARYPILSTNNSFTQEGQLTWTRASHTIRLGGEISAHQTNNNRADGLRKGRFTFNGYYSGDAFADFLLGIPDSATRATGSDRADLRRKSFSLFVRDDWKINPHLSFTLGLGYSYFQPYRSIRDNVATYYPLVFEPPETGELVVAGSPRAGELGLDPAGPGGMVFPDRNDWAPNFALALRPGGNNSLVIRSGYYIYYSPLGRESYASYLTRNYPFFYSETALSPTDEPRLSLSAPFESAAPTEIGIRGIEPNIPTSMNQNWYFSLQAEIRRLWRVEGAYRAVHGTHVARAIPANVPLPGEGDVQPRRPDTDFGRFSILTGGGSYTRHLMDLDAERRLAGGLSLKSGFVWASYFSDLFARYPSNPRDLKAERARSDWLPVRQFNFTYILDLPFGSNRKFGREATPWLQPLIGGWRLSGITRFQDGRRFTVHASGDPNNDGIAEDRPDRVGPGTIPEESRTIDRWFATEDFASPSQYGFGNAGRNILSGPAYVNWDLSVIKQTRFSDGHMVEFRIELFNAFNQVNFDQPDATFGSSLFGKVFGAYRAREIEVALRYSF